MNENKFWILESQLEGELRWDNTIQTLYATDASAYREKPLGVAWPKSNADIKKLIEFANVEKISLIPRTAGTSLAGQVVGPGLVVDVSRHLTNILELNQEENWVRLQPGVIRDELNMYLSPHGLFFGPETSTANRAMVGGMVGNNSCGSNSVVYGSTRDHLLEVKGFLSDGSEVVFKSLSLEEFEAKCAESHPEAQESKKETLETKLYRNIKSILSEPGNQQEIRKEFPKLSIPRRNTGYALDLLLETEPFTSGKEHFNFCKLIAGSEGTLMFITEIKLNVLPLPPPEKALICVHFNNIDESLRANLIALKYQPSASELIDRYIIDCTKTNIEQRQNRFFIQGEPGAILVVEISRQTIEEVNDAAALMISEMRETGLGYHFPILYGDDTKKIWQLRKAGLGLLSNLPGDAKPVPVIEDTAVDVNDLPEYIRDFNKILKKYDLYCVHYAHAGSGELHLRPIINLKTQEGNQLFRTILEEIAALVKKYNGSLSGEHGDGRLRGEFIRYMIGEKNYQLLEDLKYTWDPQGIFNPGKIVKTPAMNSSLRYRPGQETREFNTFFDFSDTKGILRAAELCNGSGDCRKTQLSGGTMCPSYMATRHEKDTTRARANILREMLTISKKSNPFDHEEIFEVMDLCLSCKGCKSECPSNVDLAKLKAEFLQHYYEANGIPLRSRLIASFGKANQMASLVPGFYNYIVSNPGTAKLFKKINGFAQERPLPRLHKTTLNRWYKKNYGNGTVNYKKTVYLFSDEFTNFNDTPAGIAAVKLLDRLGYQVKIIPHRESGRTYISKGLLSDARQLANQNVRIFKDIINAQSPLLGIEPSAILSFRDEYPELVSDNLKEPARSIAEHCLLIDEFLALEIDQGNIDQKLFTEEEKLIKLHGHCHQKALASVVPTKKMLSLPKNYRVELIPSGCCGMAGSFGYEKEHYEISMQIGELVLFPTVRKQPEEVVIAAPGTSCRHQIKDGTGRTALHPVEILYNALLD